MKKSALVAVLALLLSLLLPVSLSKADDSNPSTSEIDNYANLAISPSSKQGFSLNGSTFLNSSLSNFSVEAWVNPSESLTAGNGVIFIKQDSFYFQLNNLKPEVALHDGVWKPYATNVTLRTNEWQHLAFTKSGTTLKVFLNGTLVYQNASVPLAISSTTSYVGIGGNPYSGGNTTSPQISLFAGGMDEVRVWSIARTDSEIAQNADVKVSGSASNLLGYWDFNGNASQSTLYDRTANGYNFTINGSPNFPDLKTTAIAGGFATVTFPRTYLNAAGAYTVPLGVTAISALVVGGGGGGGFDGGGGGGGGGVYQNSNLSVTPGSSYQIKVGGGGPAINGYSGGTFCTGGWTNVAVGCLSGSGTGSAFGSFSTSGGGGGGGIESNGGADSNAAATVRGGGGGAGAQNSKAGATSGGAGAFSGGASSDVGGNAGGGGASSLFAGSSTTSSLAGGGAVGVTSSINSVVYGSGGGGGSYNNATAVSGGTNAGTGGTNSISATKPVVNRGGGGGGGGIGSGMASSGAAGVVIIKYALTGFASLSLTGTPMYKSATTITATTNTASKVTFLANNKRIPGCIKVATINLVATCTWKPSVHSYITISIQINPNDSNYASTSAIGTTVFAAKRTGTR